MKFWKIMKLYQILKLLKYEVIVIQMVIPKAIQFYSYVRCLISQTQQLISQTQHAKLVLSATRIK